MINDQKVSLEPLAVVESPFKEKFAVPRQPGLTPSVRSRLIFKGKYASQDCFEGLDEFSHYWVVFQFHQNLKDGWQPKVRPPRLGGNKKLGVFSTRSSFRPNGIGLSVGRLVAHYQESNTYCVEFAGLDLVDGTPVVDIKPYVHYADSISDATSGFAQETPAILPVRFSTQAIVRLSQITDQQLLRHQLIEILQQDPRPAYRKQSQDDREYGFKFGDWDIRWQVTDEVIIVIDLVPL